MKKSVKNVFNEGMLLDVHPAVQKTSTARKTKNFRVITRDNNSFILTSLKGTELKGSITPSYIPLAVDDKNGVAYILSAEIVNGLATGRGEIGSFPSPDYATGNLTYQYRPLMNYAGDTNTAPEKNGPFRSIRFNFDLQNIPDIELQNDYDGSINVIWASANNPMRIVNCGFVVKSGRKYELIDRSGNKDTNRYTVTNFENVINLIARSTKLMKVTLEGSVPGGILPAGNIQYYFAYATSDGNETEIVAQSFTVPIFNGEKAGNISGGKRTGEATNKMNRFTLSNLDESYAFISVFAVHIEGMNSAVKTAYRINQKYPINRSSMDFVHTGYEENIIIPLSDLDGESPAIDTASTISQVQGLLAAANIKEKKINVDALRKFSRMIRLGHKEVSLDLIGPEDNLSRLFDEGINQSALKAGTDGFNGCYLNPKNIHDKLGYWGGEAYPYLARYIFPDGSHSPLFPTTGIDNINNNLSGYIDQVSNAVIDALDSSGGFSTDGNMLNSMGIYRFPNRNVNGTAKLFYRNASAEGRVTVNGITFKIPSLNVDLGEGKTIKDYSIGIQFFRGERRADAILQGLMIDCQYVPLTRFDNANSSEKLWNYNQGGGGFTESNGKLIPAYGHILESIHRWYSYNDGGTRNRGNNEFDEDMIHGLTPFKLNLSNRNTHTIFSDYKSPFALLSSDLIVNPSKFSGISSKNITARLLYRFQHHARIATSRVHQGAGIGDHFSALIPESISTMSGASVYNGMAAWMPEQLETKNAIGFSSQARFQCRHSGDDRFYVFRNKYNAYLGIRLQTTLRAASASNAGEGGDLAFGLLNTTLDASFLANIYEGSSQRSSEAVRQVYQNIDGIRCFPISQKMYWDATVPAADLSNTLEGQLDNNRKITLFNGDCFINFTLRKLYSNAEFDDAEKDKNTRVRIGYTIGMVNEGNENSGFRSLETIDLIEGERKHPFAYINKYSGIGDNFGRNNLWREYYLPESAGYNKGYSLTSGNVLAATFPKDVPYTQSHWSTRVWVSAQHIPNSFENGYRRFFKTSYKDYPTKHGQIIKLISNNDQLFCIQETAVGKIPINERIQTGSDSAGPIFIEAPSVLGPKMKMLSEEIGSRHKTSIASTDNAVYGASLDRSILWHTAEDSLIIISDFAIRSFLDDQYGQDSFQMISHLDHNIVTTWNKKFDEVLFTFYKKENGNFNNDRTFTVQFSETSRKIHSFYSFIPLKYFRANSDLYSFNIKSGNNQFWLHDSLNESINMNTFYGLQEESSLAFVVNADDDIEKGYSNLDIDSNYTHPSLIRYRIQGAYSEHSMIHKPGNRLESNVSYEKGFWKLAIPKVTLVHNQDAERKIADVKAGATSSLSLRSRLKSKYMIIELVYNTGDLVELKSVITHYKLIP
jgi:hypothetical protein